MAARQHQLEQNDGEERSNGRHFAERMIAIGQFADDADAALIQIVYDLGCSPALLARAVRQSPSNLYARINALKKRAQNPVMLLLYESREQWPPPLSEMLMRHFLQNESIESIAQDVGVTKRWLYKEAQRAMAWAKARVAERTGRGER